MYLKRLFYIITTIQIVLEFTFVEPFVEHLSNVLEGITTTNFESHLLFKMSKHAHKEDQIAKHTLLLGPKYIASYHINSKQCKMGEITLW